MSEWIYDLDFTVLYLLIVALSVGAASVGTWYGIRSHRRGAKQEDLGMLAGAALGLLALLLAFSFSLALARFEKRRTMVLEEANAIGSAANFALMLPDTARQPVLDLLRDYATLRIGLGRPFDPAKLQQDVTRSVDLQSRLWTIGGTVTVKGKHLSFRVRCAKRAPRRCHSRLQGRLSRKGARITKTKAVRIRPGARKTVRLKIRRSYREQVANRKRIAIKRKTRVAGKKRTTYRTARVRG